MKNTNIVVLTGNLTRDSELRSSTTGKHINSFSLAVNDDYKPKDSNEWVNRAYFINCVYFGDIDGLKKGVAVSVNGKLTTKVVNKDGENKTYTQVEVSHIDFLAQKEKVEKADDTFIKGSASEVEEILPF